MGKLCESCLNYSKSYDEFRQQYYDAIKLDDNIEKHGCVMYDDCIPAKIWADKDKCPYYIKKGDNADGNN